MPVSYTHLDVYKRQNQYCGKKAAGKGRKLLRPHAGTDGNSKGVSADHQAS